MIKFEKRKGKMAECLGVDSCLATEIDMHVSRLIKEGKSLLTIVEWMRDNMELNESQFAGFMYALGYYAGANNL